MQATAQPQVSYLKACIVHNQKLLEPQDQEITHAMA